MTQPVLYMQPDLRAGFMLTCPHSAHVPGGWSYPRHDHPYFEIILVLEGEQQVRLTGRTLMQRSGDLLFITPFEAHAAAAPQAASFYCVHFDTDDIELRQQLCRIGTRLFRADNPLLHKAGPVLRRMGSSMPAGPGSSLSWRLEVSACLCSLFAALLDVSGDARHDEAGESPAVSQSALQTAERLANLIEREVELGRETPLQAAMRRLGYTAGHGNAVFRQVYGMSAQHYRSKLKLRRARHLLLDATLSVQEVGERLGYASSAHFSRQFKRWTGVSPLEFRQAQSARVDLAASRAACSAARAAPPCPVHAEPPSAPRPAQPWPARAAAS